MTNEQKRLLQREQGYDARRIRTYIENIIYNHMLTEFGFVKDKKDYLSEKELNKSQIDYILDTKSTTNIKTDKYNIANYYCNLAKEFNRISLKKCLYRNQLWEIVKQNQIMKDLNKTEHRIYKYLFRGEIIPSPRYFEKVKYVNNDLLTYLVITNLDQKISRDLEYSYRKVRNIIHEK